MAFFPFSFAVSEPTSNCSPGAGLLSAANLPGSGAWRRVVPIHTAWIPTPLRCSAPASPHLYI